MKVIVTKYATTSGIFTREGDLDSHTEKGFRSYPKIGEPSEFFWCSDWYENGISAIADVENRFARKRKSLEKQLAALDAKRSACIEAIKASGL